MKEAYHMMDSTPADIHPQNSLEDFTPLTQGQYPIFNKYPRFIVDYQVSNLTVVNGDGRHCSCVGVGIINTLNTRVTLYCGQLGIWHVEQTV